VSTDWLVDDLKDPEVKIVEVELDTTSYDKGHIRAGIAWHWQLDL